MTVLSRLWAFMTGTFDSFIGLLQRIAFALRGRSYHTGPFAMRVDHGASVRSVRIRVDHGRSLPVRGAATEPVAFPIHRVVADIPGDVEAGNFRPLPTHHRGSRGPNNCVAIREHRAATIHPPFGGCALRRTCLPAGRFVRPDDASQRFVGHDGHDAASVRAGLVGGRRGGEFAAPGYPRPRHCRNG